jgi:serine/threonine-protein kinase
MRHAVPPQIDVVRRGLLEPDEDVRIQTARKALGMLARWPEYREANGDLRELVVRYIEPNSVFVVPEGSKVSSVPEGSFSGVPFYGGVVGDVGESSASSSDVMFDPTSAAQTQPTGPELMTGEVEPELLSASEVVAIPAPRERRRRGWPFAVAGVLVAAGLGAAFVVMQSGDGPAEATDEVVAPEPSPDAAKVAALDDPDPKPDPVVAPPTEPTPDVVLDVVLDETGETGETGDEIEAGETGDEFETGELETGDADRVQVPVEFVANEFFFVYVRVGGRMLTLEPRARIQLPVGGHTVYLRTSKDEKWQKAGRIKIEPDQQYRVEMRKPAGLKLVTK